MKKFLKFLSIGALVAVLCTFSAWTAAAEKSVTDKKYTFVGNPNGLFCADDGILVYSADKLYSFSYTYDQTGERQLPGAYKYEKSALISVYSSSDGVYLISSDGNDKKLTGKADDFTVYGSRVFVASGSDVIIFDTSSDSTFTVSAGNRITSIAYSGNKVCFSTKSDSFGYSDIYEVSENGISLLFDYCKNVGYLIPGDKPLYYGAGKVTNPETKQNFSLHGDEIRVSRHGDDFYSITASGELYKTTDGVTSLVFACTSSETGYFAFPGTAYSDYGKLFVPDYANDRIAVMGESISYLDVKRPVALASDYSGNLYVYGKQGLFAYNANKLDTRPLALSYSGGAISSLAYGKKGLYALSGGKVYLYADGELTYVCDALKMRTEYFGGQLYVLQSDGVYKADGDYPTVKLSGIEDFDVSNDGSVYCLKNGEISRYSADGELIFTKNTDKNASSFSLSVVTNKYTDFGDIVITCKKTHRVFNYKPDSPAVAPEADLTYTDTTDIIRTVTDDASVYQSPNSIKNLGKIPSGATVIVGKYNLYETERMSYVLYEAEDGLKEGYIYKGLVGEAKKEHLPEFTTARTLYENTAVYRFPTAGGKKLIENVGKNVQINVLSFCDYEHNGVKWLKVSYNSQIGFIARDMLATNQTIPDDERPQYNASLKKDADIYDVVGGIYVMTGNSLKAGTDVETVGMFDQNSKYTKIRYFDTEKGVRECYVLTETLTSYSITPLQIIGLIGVGVIAILLVTVCVIKFAGKRKRMLSASGRKVPSDRNKK